MKITKFLAIGGTALVSGLHMGAAAEQERPNILWLFVEDLSPLLSCYGYENNPTPFLDQLAADGVVFQKAFMSTPVCSATRSAVITGAMPTTFGIHNHRSSRHRSPGDVIHLPEGVKPVPQIFKEAGYFTFNRGKDDYNFEYNREDVYNGEYSINWKQGHQGKPTISWRGRAEGQREHRHQHARWFDGLPFC